LADGLGKGGVGVWGGAPKGADANLPAISGWRGAKKWSNGNGKRRLLTV